MIDVRALEKSYGEHPALRSISFRVEPGEVVGFLGPNGAGKTTALRILATVLQPDAGTAVVAGYDVTRQPFDVRRRLGYLPERPPLDLDHTVREFLGFCMAVRDVPRSRRRAALEETLAATSLEDVVDRRIGNLSKGFRQRVGLAQALVHDPEWLILDEPTVGLDPAQIRDMRRFIRGLAGRKTVLLSSHLLHEVVATCSRALILHEGILADDVDLTDDTGPEALETRFLWSVGGVGPGDEEPVR